MKINISDMLDGIEICEYIEPSEYDAERIKEKVHLKLCETKERGNKMEKKIFSKRLIILAAAIAAMSATTIGVNAATDGLIYEKLSSNFLNITISSVGEGDIVNEQSFKIYVNDEEVSSDKCGVDFKDYPDDAEPGRLFVWIENEDYVVEAEFIGDPAGVNGVMFELTEGYPASFAIESTYELSETPATTTVVE